MIPSEVPCALEPTTTVGKVVLGSIGDNIIAAFKSSQILSLGLVLMWMVGHVTAYLGVLGVLPAFCSLIGGVMTLPLICVTFLLNHFDTVVDLYRRFVTRYCILCITIAMVSLGCSFGRRIKLSTGSSRGSI
jgi:hypothetical protein